MTTLTSLIERDSVRAEVRYGSNEPTPDGFVEFNPWTVTLRRKRRQLSVPFYTGPAITEDPDVHNVLDCILSDALAGEQDFEDFARDYGYDEDSRRAYTTWEACGKMAERVRRFLVDADTFEEYAYADRD